MSKSAGFAVQVYFEDTDAAGVVYHSNYLNFLERARTETLKILGWNHSQAFNEGSPFFMIRKISVDYLRPAKLDDALDIRTSLIEIRGARIELDQSIWRGETCLLTAKVQLACVRQNGQVCRVPQAMKMCLERL
ncbi:MAG: tol-pal system-associated acyl-CoA thioesterase [bacterium]|nr:tol-pal system-associated acyl-CoA thioesterase [bacterium]